MNWKSKMKTLLWILLWVSTVELGFETILWTLLRLRLIAHIGLVLSNLHTWRLEDVMYEFVIYVMYESLISKCRQSKSSREQWFDWFLLILSRHKGWLLTLKFEWVKRSIHLWPKLIFYWNKLDKFVTISTTLIQGLWFLLDLPRNDAIKLCWHWIFFCSHLKWRKLLELGFWYNIPPYLR